MQVTAKTLVIASTFYLRLEVENIYTFPFQQSTPTRSTVTVNGIVHISQRVAHKRIFSCCPFVPLFCCSCQGHDMGKGGVDRIRYMSSVITLTLHFPMGNHAGEGKSLTGSFPYCKSQAGSWTFPDMLPLITSYSMALVTTPVHFS